MSSKSKKTKPDIIEKKIYEFFGIRLFRKLAFEIESFVHRKDNSWNINYHLCGSGINAIQSFTGYLLLNAVCHGISIAFIAVYFAITLFVRVGHIALDISLFILFFVHLYCIILQRYSYIRIQSFAKRRINSINNRVAAKIELLSQRIERREYKKLQEEYSLIKRIKETINNGTECLIEKCDASALHNISSCSYDIFKINHYDKHRNYNRESLENIIRRIPKHPVLVSRVEKIAASLQNIFHFEKRSNVLFGFSVITETKDCENAYRELIQDTSRDYIEFVFDVLFGAYDKVLLYPEETQV